MRGRKPVPTQLKLLRGNPGRRPLPTGEPAPARMLETIAPPAGLEARARKEWRRMAPLLAKNGLLTELDLDALAAYCTAAADWHDARRHVARQPMIAGPNGYRIPSPYVKLARAALHTMRALMTDFGMTPAARARVTKAAPDAAPASNPLDKFLRR